MESRQPQDPRAQFVATCDAKLRLVRSEAGLTQEDMAYAIGISKKTLVDIEKQRRTLGWAGAVALCAVFPDSGVLQAAFGDDPSPMIRALARTVPVTPAPAANIWWETVAENDRFVIEQNTVSQHYRLLTASRRRVAASFDIDDLIPIFNGQAKE